MNKNSKKVKKYTSIDEIIKEFFPKRLLQVDKCKEDPSILGQSYATTALKKIKL